MEEEWPRQRPKESVMAAYSYHVTSPHVTLVVPWVVELARLFEVRERRLEMEESEGMKRRRARGAEVGRLSIS